MRILIMMVMFTGLVSCTWVKLTGEGSNVAVMTAQQVGNCTRVGETTVMVRDKVVFQRDPEKVTRELETLARNSAATRGGDTVVATSAVRGGERDYDIYQCRR